jgi:hypothetical protein
VLFYLSQNTLEMIHMHDEVISNIIGQTVCNTTTQIGIFVRILNHHENDS